MTYTQRVTQTVSETATGRVVILIAQDVVVAARKGHSMIRQCDNCLVWFEDVYRDTSCPHGTFPANDGNNNFKHHGNSYLSKYKPSEDRIFEAHNVGGSDAR